ncbi:MAG: hypothetical protein ACI4NG_02850 [Candidatus Gallimonas sp.]
MERKYERIGKFLSACDEMIGGKFAYAEIRASEILKTIAASEDLTALFSAVTDQFDYISAKREFLRFPAEPGASHGAVFLPSDRGAMLAFVFCLLVEIDGGALRLNDFLLRYFYEDGSYTASYSLFVERLIRPFRDIVRDCFPDVDRKALRLGREEQAELDAIAVKIQDERQRLASLSVGEAEKHAGDLMLSEAYAAAGRGDSSAIAALMCGYGYFLRAIGGESAESEALFDLIAE